MPVSEPFGVQEYFIDGYDDFEVRDGVLSCVGFRNQLGHKIAVVRIAMPVAGLAESIAKRGAAMDAYEVGRLMPSSSPPKHLS